MDGIVGSTLSEVKGTGEILRGEARRGVQGEGVGNIWNVNK